MKQLRTGRYRVMLAMALFAIVPVVLLASGARRPVLAAATCAAHPCMRVDAIPGGGIDASASVGGSFSVDIVLEGTNNNIAAFNFSLAYDPTLVRASAPTNDDVSSSGMLCDQPPRTGATDQSDGGDDHNPATVEAFMSCYFGDGESSIGDGVIAHVPFVVLAGGTSPLRLVTVAAASTDAVTQIACDPEGISSGGCSDAAVSTSGGPPPPPPPPVGGDQCAVQFALDGETVQCLDGSRVRFIGVASPLGADAGAGWATALTHWFLAGKTLTLEKDVAAADQFGSRYGYPHVTGSDGNDYNISALLIYVGMAHHLSDGVNVHNDAWFDAAQVWARTACWNMWSAGNPFAAESGCH